mmetsp:Transcript_25127/g.54313  ORF Transcript_25127/g.54313 Transcript_25127/m.54313 type:complete len:234 (-) Transcript_25127:66-767(-)
MFQHTNTQSIHQCLHRFSCPSSTFGSKNPRKQTSSTRNALCLQTPDHLAPYPSTTLASTTGLDSSTPPNACTLIHTASSIKRRTILSACSFFWNSLPLLLPKNPLLAVDDDDDRWACFANARAATVRLDWVFGLCRLREDAISCDMDGGRRYCFFLWLIIRGELMVAVVGVVVVVVVVVIIRRQSSLVDIRLVVSIRSFGHPFFFFFFHITLYFHDFSPFTKPRSIHFCCCCC